MPTTADLAAAIDRALPQTQCTRCGYPDCAGYAQAVAAGSAGINQCPPGGQAGVERLAKLTGHPVVPLNPANGVEGPRAVAIIDETWCIGCTLCIDACPVDCIVGAPKLMHTVAQDQCTGCELCLPACPVDCITLANRSGAATGWAAWSPAQAEAARARYALRGLRLEREREGQRARHATPAEATPAIDPKRAAIDTALARARARRIG